MSKPSKDLEDFWEEVDSGVHGHQQIENELQNFQEPQARREAELGVELLGMLGELSTDSQSGQVGSDTNPTGSLPRMPSKFGDMGSINGKKIGRYQLVEAIGRGGCGAVFLATDTMLKRKVALKIPAVSVLADESSHQRFLTEARSAALLTHPNIVGIYQADIENGVWYIASEYCSGPDLARVIADPSILPAADDPPSAGGTNSGTIGHRLAASMVADLADAVEHAHRNGVVHRDIKPANVLVEWSNRDPSEGQPQYIPKLTDFGLAKFIAEQDASVTATGARVGTVAYMAPEQIDADQSKIGIETDIYGLGNLLYELLTGQLPFGRSADLATLNAIKQSTPPRPRSIDSTIPPALEAIAMRCLEKTPRDRFASAAEVSQAIRSWLGDSNGSTTHGKIPTSWPSRSRRRFRAAIAATGFAALTLGLVLMVGRGTEIPGGAEPGDSISAGATDVDPLASIRRDLATYLPLTRDLKDASGHGIDARIGGGDPEFSDTVGPAIDLDGAGDFLTLDYPQALQFGEDTSFTVAGWFFINGDQAHRSRLNPLAMSVDVPVISSHRMANRLPGMFAGPVVYEDSSDSAGWGLELQVGNYLRGIASNGEYFRSSDLQKIQRNQWIFLCLILDRELGEMRIWNAGQYHDKIPIPPGSLDSFGDGLAINVGQDGAGKSNHFLKARLNHLAIWSRALSKQEVNAYREVGRDRVHGLLAAD